MFYFRGLSHVMNQLKQKASFVFDRGYDMNALFKLMHQHEQRYIVSLIYTHLQIKIRLAEC